MKINQIYICVLLFLLCSIANGHCSKKIIATKKLYHGFNKLECDILDRIKESKLVYDIELIKYLGLDTNYIGENRNVYIYSKYQLYDSISILIVSDSYVNSNAADYNIISFKNCKRISSLYIRLVGDTEREIGVSEYSDFEMFNNTLVQKVNYKVKTVIKNNKPLWIENP